MSSPAPTPPTKRLLLAGVAIAGASVVAVHPVTPTLPEIQDRAVQLSAFVDPISTWQTTFETAAGHVQYGLNAITTETLPALERIASASPAVLAELAEALTNQAGLQQLFADLPAYGEILNTALEGAAAGSQMQWELLPAMLEGVATDLAAGEFTEAFQEFNYWFLFTVGEAGWPLFPALEIPGDIANTLGAERIANLFDALLTNNAGGGYAYALLGPPITATFQATEVLDAARIAAEAGDWETAVSELVNMPGKVTNAFLNGYTPSFSPEPWPGLLTTGGPFESFLFNIPNAIAWALNPSSVTATTTEGTELSRVTSTELASTKQLLTLDVESAAATPATDADLTSMDSIAGAVKKATAALTVDTAVTTEDTAADATVVKTSTDATTETAGSEVEEVEGGEAEGAAAGEGTAGTSGTTGDATTDGTEDESETGEADNGKTETGKPETGKPETGKTETGKPDKGKSGDNKPDKGKTGDNKSDKGKTGDNKSGKGKSDSGE